MPIISKTSGTFKSFDSTEIYYETHGEGEPLVLCYGIGCLINHWNHQISFFSRHYKVIAIDYRGHQKSALPKDINNMSAEAIVRDLTGLLDHLNITSAHFAGHSFGAPILLQLTHEHPQRVLSLTLINGFYQNPLATMFNADITDKIFKVIKYSHSFLPETINFLWNKGINNTIAMYLSALLGGFNLKLVQFKDIEVYAKGISSINLNGFITLFNDLVSFDGESILKEIQQPCLIIGGLNDSITPIEKQRNMAQLLPNSQFHVIKQGSHCSQLDMPDQVNRLINDFLISL